MLNGFRTFIIIGLIVFITFVCGCLDKPMEEKILDRLEKILNDVDTINITVTEYIFKNGSINTMSSFVMVFQKSPARYLITSNDSITVCDNNTRYSFDFKSFELRVKNETCLTFPQLVMEVVKRSMDECLYLTYAGEETKNNTSFYVLECQKEYKYSIAGKTYTEYHKMRWYFEKNSLFPIIMEELGVNGGRLSKIVLTLSSINEQIPDSAFKYAIQGPLGISFEEVNQSLSPYLKNFTFRFFLPKSIPEKYKIFTMGQDSINLYIRYTPNATLHIPPLPTDTFISVSESFCTPRKFEETKSNVINNSHLPEDLHYELIELGDGEEAIIGFVRGEKGILRYCKKWNNLVSITTNDINLSIGDLINMAMNIGC